MSASKQKTKTEILDTVIPLFARAGYTGVSMRQIARAVGIQAASLYHHFPDKETLYIQALAQTFSRHNVLLRDAFALAADPEQRLRRLVSTLCTLVHRDGDFSRLMQREIMDGDEQRLQLLADKVFSGFFQEMITLCRALAPNRDPHLFAVSILGLVIYHYQVTPIRSFLPGFKASHNDPETVAKHILSLLQNL
ncbi:TetR/AcrR family transcriptional regulator [Desulfolithobacter sp.]